MNGVILCELVELLGDKLDRHGTDFILVINSSDLFHSFYEDKCVLVPFGTSFMGRWSLSFKF